MLDKVVSRLEAQVLRKRFNQLGGLQLEKDVRTLVGTCWGMIVPQKGAISLEGGGSAGFLCLSQALPRC